MRKLSIATLALATLVAFAPVGAQQSDSGPDMSDEPTDTLARAKAKGKLIACADPYDWPSAAQGEDPPGFDIEIIRRIAKQANLRLEIYWANTGTRGGIMRAFRNSILAKRCDVFVGLSDNGEADLLPGRLVFTNPYLSLGYVLVVQGKAEGLKSLDDVKQAGLKVGVPMSTVIDDYLFTNNISRELYLNNRRLIQGMMQGEVDASMVWATAVAVARNEYPDAKLHIADGYVPMQGQRFNMKFAVRKEDKTFLEFINQGIEELLGNGGIKQILESYGVPFYAPLAS